MKTLVEIKDEVAKDYKFESAAEIEKPIPKYLLAYFTTVAERYADQWRKEEVKAADIEPLTKQELKELLRLAFESGKNTGLYWFSSIEQRKRSGATPYYHFFEEWFKAVISSSLPATAGNNQDNENLK